MNKLIKTRTDIHSSVQSTDYITGSNLLANLHQIHLLRDHKYSSLLLLTDKNIFKLHGEKVVSSLKKLNKQVIVSLVEPGEKSKDFSVIPNIVKPFFQKGFDRKAAIVALGGGVITDLGGFIASILMRGLDAIYLPTTLLGQIDAAIGGKTGVNLTLTDDLMLKNMLGTIAQPKVVISDVDTLLTLPKKEILNGLGEMAKYWVGWNCPNIQQLNTIASLASTSKVERDKLIEIISICQKIKIDIVQKDPLEKLALRQKLNLGHTLGHAIESASAGTLSHGQAVAIGLAAAAKISLLKKFCTEKTYSKIIDLLQSLGLPAIFHVTMYRNMITRNKVIHQILTALTFDKKGGTFVLIRDIGILQTGVKVENKLIEKVLEEIIL